MQKLLDWWEKGVFAGLCLSILLLGVGRIEFFAPKGSMSAWSVSRTTFFFWLIYRLFILLNRGRPRVDWAQLRPWAPLCSFFVIVTVSLLPNFRLAGDYRYFAFACAHALMVADLFAKPARRKWLLYALGVVPLVLVVRGFIHDPSVFSFAVASRFGFPLDHPNTAGYLLSMSVPLCLLAASAERGWWRGLASVSFAAQLPALLLTYSRGAWLGSSVAIIIFGALTKKWKFLIAILLLAAISVLVSPPLRQRGATLLQPSSDQSISDRVQLANDAIRLGIDKPILGVGYGRGRLKEALRQSYRGTVDENSPIWHTHNLYIELFAETGFLGLAVFLWLAGDILRRLMRSMRARSSPNALVGIALGAAWSAALVTGLGDVPFYHHETRIFFFSLIALAYLYARDASAEVSPIRRT
jgi:O-antigen ligase